MHRPLTGRWAAPLAVLFACDGAFEAPPEERAQEEENRQSALVCAAEPAVGWRQGVPFAITLARVDGEQVQLHTANALHRMRAAAAAEGVSIRVASGYRSFEEQAELYSCYVNCSCNNCNLAARPGRSNHNSGSALDLNTHDRGVLAWLEANAADYGFRRTVPGEPWHWEYEGPDLDGPCSEPAASTCAPLSLQGGFIDLDGGCVTLGGEARWWRRVEDGGYVGAYAWTGATASAVPSVYALWQIRPAAPGDFRLTVNLPAGADGAKRVRYLVRHAEGVEEVVVDQSVGPARVELGVFPIWDQASVSLTDNTGELSSLGRKVRVDAISVQPVRSGRAGACVRPDAVTVLEEDGPCAELGGPERYLRSVEGAGHGGSYVWTGATSSESDGNYARWDLSVERSGLYKLEAYVGPGLGTSQRARYRVYSAAALSEVHVDQSTADGFVDLGTHILDTVGATVTLGDATGEGSHLGRRIVFDALRVTPLDGYECSTVIATENTQAHTRPSPDAPVVLNLGRHATADRLATVTGAEVDGEIRWHQVRVASVIGYVNARAMTCR